MNKNTKINPKDKDILVLKNNRDVIYEYNAKSRTRSCNAFNISVNKALNIVTYKSNNRDVVAYNAEWDFATEEEIKIFYELIRQNAIQCRKEFAEEIAYSIIDHYCFDADNPYSPNDYNETAESISKKIYDIINEHFAI